MLNRYCADGLFVTHSIVSGMTLPSAAIKTLAMFISLLTLLSAIMSITAKPKAVAHTVIRLL
jgi:hypothetical protein